MQDQKTLNFIENARISWDKRNIKDYDTSEIIYKNTRDGVIVIDTKYNTKHLLNPRDILRKGISCCITNAIDKNQYFIIKSKEAHKSNDVYGYEKSVYKGNKEQIEIYCPIHKYFWQEAHSHMAGIGCKKCGIIKSASLRCITKEKFLELANKKFNRKFIYDLNTYIDYDSIIKIICPNHGEFEQTPNNHLSGKKSNTGCKKCGINVRANNRMIPDKNNSAADKFPEFIPWLLPENNNNKTLYDFKLFSKQKVVWTCDVFKHTYERTVQSQLIQCKSCPYCNSLIQKSQIELKILFELKYFYPEINVFKNDITIDNKIYKCDIVIPSIKTVIEYDGVYYHKKKLKTDKRKTKKLQLAGYRVIRIRHNSMKKITNEDVFYNSDLKSNEIFTIKKIVSDILYKINYCDDKIQHYNYNMFLFGDSFLKEFNNTLERFGILSEEKIEILKELYIKQNLSRYKVCEKMNISEHSFYKNFVFYNIKKKGKVKAQNFIEIDFIKLDELIKKGNDGRQIAKELGMCFKVLKNKLQNSAYIDKIRLKKGVHKKILNIDILKTMYDGKKTLLEISEYFGVSIPTINDRLKENKIYKKNNRAKKQILQTNLNNDIIETFSSISDAAKKLHICSSDISKCARSIKKSAGGFKWKYV